MTLPANTPPREKPVRIVAVDTDQFFMLGISAYLRDYPHIKMVGCATAADDVFNLVEEWHPDIVLANICLPGKSGIELTAELHGKAPWIQTIVYSAHIDDRLITDAIDAGIKAYLLKSDKPEILLKAVETVMKGERYLTDVVAGRLLMLMQRTETNPIKQQKKIIHTDFEIAVLRATCKGLSADEIACKLKAEVRLVTSTKERLFKQINIKTSLELAMYAVKNYIYDPWA